VTRGGDPPSVLDLQHSQAILQFAELFLLLCDLGLLSGDILPCSVSLLFETLTLLHSLLQTPP
jgi:hypothetical protein